VGGGGERGEVTLGMSKKSLACQNTTKAKTLFCKNSYVVSMLLKFSEDEHKMNFRALSAIYYIQHTHTITA
jgi:hypothetical protein